MPTKVLNLGRLAKIAALGVLAIGVVYLTVANLLLGGNVIQREASSDPDSLLLTTGRAWTLWPGRVHVRDLILRFQDSNVQMYMTLEEGTVDVNLWELSRKSFHATRVRGSGVRFWFRHKTSDPEAGGGRYAAYAPIPGFESLPLRTFGPPRVELTDKTYNLWTIELDDVTATARDLWFMEYRSRGAARASGAFRLKPMREVWVDAGMTFEPSLLTLGARTVAKDFHGTLGVKVPNFDVRVPAGLDVLRQVSVDLGLAATVEDLSVAEPYVGTEPRLEGGHGPLRIEGRMDRGVFTPGTTLSYETGAASARSGPLVVSGPLSFLARFDGEPRVLTATVKSEAVATRLALASPWVAGTNPAGRAKAKTLGAEAQVLAKGPSAVVRIRGGDVSQDFLPEGAELALPSVESEDISWLDGLVGSSGLHVTGGRAKGKANVVIVAGSASDRGATGSASGVLNLEGVSLRAGAVETAGYWVRASAEGTRFVGFPPRTMEGRVVVQGKDGAPLATYLAKDSGLPRVLSPLLTTGPLEATCDVRQTKVGWDVDVGKAKVGSVEAKGHYRTRGASRYGAFLARAGLLSTGLELKDGNLAVSPLAGEGWLAEHR